MSLVVTALMTDIDLAESATPWGTAALDADFYKQGNNSAGFYMAKNARGSETVTPASSVAWSSYTYPHLYFWMNSAVAAKMENKSTGTTTASGVTVRVTLANGAYREWHVTGADVWDGGWERPFVIDMSHTGTQLYASSGTWTNTSNIASITWYFDLSNSGNIRNVPANCWLDAIRVGEGLQVHNTSAADAAIDLAAVAAVDENVSNQYGVLRQLQPGAEGAFGAAGKVIFGDSSGSNHLDFDTKDESLIFLERDGSGYGLVNSNLYSLEFVGNATGSDQDVNFGTKVGTGDTASGRNGTQIRAGGSTVSYSVDLSDANLHNVTIYGSVFEGADGGVGATGVPTTTFEIIGNTFDACDQIDTRDAVVRNCFFLNTVAVSTSGALLWDTAEIDAKNCTFVNNAVGVEIPTASANISFVGMEFSGNTNDVRYEGASNYDLNWSDASAAPSIQNAGAGTLTAKNSINFSFTVNPSITGYEWRIYEVTAVGSLAGASEVDGEESATADNQTYAYEFSASQPIAVQILAIDDDYEEKIEYYTLTANAQDVTINLVKDIND